MIHIFVKLIDLLFPPSESLCLIRRYSNTPITALYTPQNNSGITSLSHYQHPYIKACITAGKFEHNQKALSKLGELLTYHFSLHQDEYLAHEVLLVPIPLHPKRERERGYNQVAVIMRKAITQYGYQRAPLLKRTINTSPQSHHSRQERQKNLTNAFFYTDRSLDWSSIKRVILIDDVTTTGSTLQVAKSALMPHLPRHIKLDLLAIAH